MLLSISPTYANVTLRDLSVMGKTYNKDYIKSIVNKANSEVDLFKRVKKDYLYPTSRSCKDFLTHNKMIEGYTSDPQIKDMFRKIEKLQSDAEDAIELSNLLIKLNYQKQANLGKILSNIHSKSLGKLIINTLEGTNQSAYYDELLDMYYEKIYDVGYGLGYLSGVYR